MRFSGVTLMAALLTGVTALPAQTITRTIVVSRGSDTIAVEQVQRVPGRLEGELVFHSANQRWHYVATIASDQRVTVLENEFRLASDASTAPAKQTARLLFVGDSVLVTFSGPTPPPQRVGSAAGAMPFINPSFALVEQALRRARQMGRGDKTVPLFAVAGGQIFPAEVRWLGTDSVEFVLGGAPTLLSVGLDGSLRGGTVPSQGLVITVTEGAAAGALVVAKPDYSAPAGARYTAEPAQIHTPIGHTLAGTLTLPKGAAGPVPAVVIISGSGPQDRDGMISIVKGYRPFREFAEALAAAGVAVLRVDDRGFGESGGSAASATSADFAEDVRASLAFLRGRQDIDGRRLALLGHSEGGLIAPLVAAGDSALRGIVLLAGPAYTGRRIIEFQNRYAIERLPDIPVAARDSMLRVAMRGVDSAAASLPWIRYFLEYDPAVTARKVRTPVLILQGATDQQVTPDQAAELDRAFKAAGNRDVTMQVFPATNHLFLADPDGNPAGYMTLKPTTVRPEVIRVIVEWLSRHLAR